MELRVPRPCLNKLKKRRGEDRKGDFAFFLVHGSGSGTVEDEESQEQDRERFSM